MPTVTLANGKTLYQSKAIINYIGAKAGLHPTDPLDIYKGELMFQNLVDEYMLSGKSIYSVNFASTPEGRQEKFEMVRPLWPELAERLNACLSDDKRFIAGDKMTTYDYVVGINLINLMENPNHHDETRAFWIEIRNSSPIRLQRYISSVQAELMPYLAMRPKLPK